MRVGHAQTLFRFEIFGLAVIVDRPARRACAQRTRGGCTRVLILLIRVKIERFPVLVLENVLSVLGIMSEQSKVEALKRRRAFGRQLFTDALFFFEAFNLMTARAAVLLDLRTSLSTNCGSSMNDASP